MATTLTQGVERHFEHCEDTAFAGLPCKHSTAFTTYSVQLHEGSGWVMLAEECSSRRRGGSCSTSSGTHHAGARDIDAALSSLSSIGIRALYTPEEEYEADHQAFRLELANVTLGGSPHISMVHPLTGPIEGGTMVTMRGPIVAASEGGWRCHFGPVVVDATFDAAQGNLLCLTPAWNAAVNGLVVPVRAISDTANLTMRADVAFTFVEPPPPPTSEEIRSTFRKQATSFALAS